jgi:hypothetical protein
MAMTASAQHETRVFRDVIIDEVDRALDARGASSLRLRSDQVIGNRPRSRQGNGRFS